VRLCVPGVSSGGQADVTETIFMTAEALAERIRRRELSPVDAVQQTLARIERTQGTLNAFITVTGEQALAEARAAEHGASPSAGPGPLHGVPVSVKDIINTAGVRTTWGSLLMRDNVPSADAVAVERLRAAGAILVGKTSTPEFAHKLLTDAPLFGTTRNPWNTELTPGGSSGGAAVAVACGMGPIALATDAGASTRLPAACTGVVGLKPTLGAVPHSQVPDGFNNFIHLGLMGRTVRDVALMLDVVAGPHPSDPHSVGTPRLRCLESLDAAGDPFRGRRIAYRPRLGNRALDPEVRAACDGAAAQLEALGAEVELVDEAVENAEPAWRVLQQANWAMRFFERLDEVAERLDPSFAEGIRAGGAYTGMQLQRAVYRRTEFYRTVQRWFGEFDFVLTPTCSRPPLRADHGALAPIEVGGETVGDMRAEWVPYLNLFDLTGHPAVSVPCGFTSDGLPVGMQLVGRWYEDGALLALAAGFEAAHPWRQHLPPAGAG